MMPNCSRFQNEQKNQFTDLVRLHIGNTFEWNATFHAPYFALFVHL